jgi:acylphosphatase
MAEARPVRSRQRVLVTGRVQGVGFRESCRRRAEAARLTGYVRNLPDGTVEAVFEGDPVVVAELVEWCRSGPALAAVRHVATVTEEPLGETGFRIR